MKRLTLLAAFFFTVAACTAPPPTSREGAEIAERSDIWDAAFDSGDVDALVSLYTEDARLLPPNGKIAQGHDAVRAAFGEMIGSGLSGELTTIEARIAGDIAYHVGTFTLSANDGTLVDSGKFIETWQLNDGEWLITHDIWNSSMAAHQPMEPMAATPHATLMAVHEVEDPARWLAAWEGEDSRRELFRKHGARHVHVFQSTENPNLTGLVIAVDDMAALQAFLESEEADAAKAEDGVRNETIQFFAEAR